MIKNSYFKFYKVKIKSLMETNSNTYYKTNNLFNYFTIKKKENNPKH